MASPSLSAGRRRADLRHPPGQAVIDEVPKTSVGKFDKKVLRRALADGDLAVERSEAVR